MGIIREKHVRELYDVESTARSLQKFLDKIESNLHSLRALDVNLETCDLLLVHHLSTKLDVKSRKELESMKRPDSNVTYEHFKDFIKNVVSIIIHYFASKKKQSLQPRLSSRPKSQWYEQLYHIKSF